MDYEIEAVAQALYAVTDGARRWTSEPDFVQEIFRAEARAVITALDDHRQRCQVEQVNRFPDEAPAGRDMLRTDKGGDSILSQMTKPHCGKARVSLRYESLSMVRRLYH